MNTITITLPLPPPELSPNARPNRWAEAMLKSAFDGMVDAGLMVNDSGLDHKRATFAVDAARPRVEITIEKHGS